MKLQTLVRTNANQGGFLFALVGVIFVFASSARAGDPRTNSWFTTFADRYARIYPTDAAKISGASIATWTNGTTAQSLSAYSGVQEVYSSSNWVYIRTTGLGSFVMGPWYLNTQHTQMFPDWPVNQKVLFRIPRQPTVSATKSITSGGAIGYFVDGVAMFNSWDAYYWNGSGDVQAGGTGGYWNRDAYVNESATFDPGNAHQANGQYHYHANPPALRYLLGDHVNYGSTTKTYSEDTNAPTKHSPILGWVADGYPIYGPYGYSNPTNPANGIRRMISGCVPRDGTHGTDNLSTNGAPRATIPAWAQRLFGASADQSGPTVSTSYPFERYMEDNAYLGDLTNPATGSNYQQGVDFDLDEYNGRWCVTPEFPDGTYAYFVSISSNGTPVFPYNIGRGFYGVPAGGAVSTISETVVTNFLGAPNHTPSLNPPTVKNGTVTLTWSATEGGTYRVESTTNFATWTTNATTVSAVLDAASYTNNSTDGSRFYRVARTALASYDSAGTTVFSNGSVAPGGSANPGTTVSVAITLPSTPPWPPANTPITSVTLAGGISGTNLSDSTQGQVVAIFTIPADAPTGAQNVVVTFTSGPTYTLSGGFTIN